MISNNYCIYILEDSEMVFLDRSSLFKGGFKHRFHFIDFAIKTISTLLSEEKQFHNRTVVIYLALDFASKEYITYSK